MVRLVSIFTVLLFSSIVFVTVILLLDAQGQTIGRLCSQIAVVLQGKHNPCYVFHHNMRCYVVVINARHLQITKKKLQQNIYYSHSGYPGGLKQRR